MSKHGTLWFQPRYFLESLLATRGISEKHRRWEKRESWSFQPQLFFQCSGHIISNENSLAMALVGFHLSSWSRKPLRKTAWSFQPMWDSLLPKKLLKSAKKHLQHLDIRNYSVKRLKLSLKLSEKLRASLEQVGFASLPGFLLLCPTSLCPFKLYWSCNDMYI